MDIALMLDRLIPAAVYRGSLTDNTQAAYDAVVWTDSRAKPDWTAIETAWSDYLAEQQAKAYAATAMQTAFMMYITGLNAKYTGLNLDPTTDTEETALIKCLSCTAPDGTTGMIAADCSTLDWYQAKIKQLK